MKQLKKYIQKDAIAQELIKHGKFELEKYELVNSCKWSQVFETMEIATIDDALKSDTPSLATIRKYKGRDTAIILLCRMIGNLAENFNLGMNMRPEQIRLAAKMIYTKFYYLKLSDFRLCFDHALSGQYGTTYNRLDTQILCEWLNTYNSDRLAAAQFNAQEENRLRKEGKFEKEVKVDPEGLKKIKELREKLEEKNILQKKQEIKRDGIFIKDTRTPEQKESDRLAMQAEIDKYQREYQRREEEE